MPTRSIVMLPTSRVKRTWLAVGGNVEALGGVGAEEEHLSLPCRRRRCRCRRPDPTRRCRCRPPSRRRRCLLAVDEVVAVAADERVGALAADDAVVAGAAVDGEVRTPAGSWEASTPSSPPRAFTVSESKAPSAPVMFTWAGSPMTESGVPCPATTMLSAALVPVTMTVSAWPSPTPLPGVPRG